MRQRENRGRAGSAPRAVRVASTLALLCAPLATGWAQSAEAVPDKVDEADEAAANAELQALQALASIEWTEGPAKVTIGSEGELAVPEGLRFTGPAGTRTLLELMRNPTDGSELGLLTGEDGWFLLFEFNDIGYVKDADKEKLDAEALLASLREGNEAGNAIRRERGWNEIRIVGWHTRPFYNPETNNLEWCLEGESEGRKIINYNTRILGRGGVMSANLLVDPEKLAEVLPVSKQALAGFSFVPGKRYSEWRAGDKVAEYGLAALVVGGAAGVAAKMGLFAKLAASLGKLWKAILFGLVGLGVALKRLFTGRGKASASDVAGGPPAAPPPAGP